MSEHDEQAKLFAIASYRPELRWMFAIPNGGQTSGENRRLKDLHKLNFCAKLIAIE